MSCFTVVLDPKGQAIKSTIAPQAGLKNETEMSETSINLAGELALEAISRKRAQ